MLAFSDFLVGIGLLFVIEGLMLAGVPGWVRGTMENVSRMPDHLLRLVGLISAIGGLILIWFVRR